jgi:hypothetical protein
MEPEFNGVSARQGYGKISGDEASRCRRQGDDQLAIEAAKQA